MTVEQQLVQHLRDVSYGDLPPEAVNAAKREVLWTLGTSVAGAGATGSDQIVEFVRMNGGREESTVIGYGDRLPAVLAGLANGSFAKALEYEDKLWMDSAHGYAIGTSVVPAAFAMAEHLGGISGERFLTAVALATDVAGRMMRAVPRSIETGWNATYIYSAFAATMVAGKLLELSEEQFLNAMGLAYAQTTGNRQGHVEAVLGVRMQMGFGVRNGISAAMLAKLGVTGAHQFLTGRFGLYNVYFKELEIALNALTENLGTHFEGTRLGFKAYPCGAVVHPVLDAVLSFGPDLVEKWRRITALRVYGSPRLMIMVEPKEERKNPRSHVETQFSLPWAVACTLIDQQLSLKHFTENALLDERYRTLARLVDSDMSGRQGDGVRVEIDLDDGRTLRSPVIVNAKGHADNPQTTDEMVQRYRDCVQFGPKPLPTERTEQAKDLILDLQKVANVTEIIRLLA